MIAALPMYDMAQLRPAHAALWASVRKALGFGPETLSFAHDSWRAARDPGLLLGQTCGLHYRARLFGQVKIVGALDYGVKGCMPGHYCSVIVAALSAPDRLEDFRTRRFAVNEGLSQSGWGGPYRYFRQKGIEVTALKPTGSHYNAALMVARRRADLAATDAVTWAYFQRFEKDLVGMLKVIDRTQQSAGLPLITGKGQDLRQLIEAVQQGVDTMEGTAKHALGLRGFVPVQESAYLSLPMPPAL
jgi:ABC-type phosphate/phosphonate transport system substrate-binding protein